MCIINWICITYLTHIAWLKINQPMFGEVGSDFPKLHFKQRSGGFTKNTDVVEWTIVDHVDQGWKKCNSHMQFQQTPTPLLIIDGDITRISRVRTPVTYL